MAFITRLLDRLTALRVRRGQRRVDQALSRLPAYLLKDMGLHYEAGELRPLASQFEASVPPLPPKLTLIQGGATRETRMFHVEHQQRTAPPSCQHCGAPLR